MWGLCAILGIPTPSNRATLEQLELCCSLMARAQVSISLQEWKSFAPMERLAVADAYERHALTLAVTQGACSRSHEAAAAAFQPVDGGASLIRTKLEAMAEEALA